MANDFCTICPAVCDDTLDLPAIDANQDCITIVYKKSQICGLVIQPTTGTGSLPAAPGASWTDPTYWATAVDNTVTDNSAFKYVVGIGGLPAAEKTEIELPKNKVRALDRTYTITFSVRNLTDNHYAFFQSLQCGWTGFQFWYETVGGRFFGGETGITPSKVDVDFSLSEGVDDYEEAVLTLTFEACGDPPRTDSPF